MSAHELLRQVKAKSLSVKISKNDPNTARVNWQLADGEFLTVEIPRYVLERFIVQAKRAIEEAPLLSIMLAHGFTIELMVALAAPTSRRQRPNASQPARAR